MLGKQNLAVQRFANKLHLLKINLQVCGCLIIQLAVYKTLFQEILYHLLEVLQRVLLCWGPAVV